MIDHIAVSRQDSFEIPREYLVEGILKRRAIRYGEIADQPARTEMLPHSVQFEERSGAAVGGALNVEAQVGDDQATGRTMKKHDLFQSKTLQQEALDLAHPGARGLVRERPSKGKRPAAPGWRRSGEEFRIGVDLRDLFGKLSVGIGNDDEPHSTQRADYFALSSFDGNGRMKNQLPVAQTNDRHADWDWNEPGLPAKLVLGTPKIRVVLNQGQSFNPYPYWEASRRHAARHYLIPYDKSRHCSSSQTRNNRSIARS